MEFCAVESCGKCTPCRIGSVRGAEVIDRIGRGENIAANLHLVDDLCTTMKAGSLCALGGFTPYPVSSAIRHFREDFGAGVRSQPLSKVSTHAVIKETDYGTPAAKTGATVSLTIDGFPVTVPEAPSIMRAAMDAGIQVPKLCATDSLEPFGSCRLCLVEIAAAPARRHPVPRLLPRAWRCRPRRSV